MTALLPTDDRYPATSLEDCQRLCELGTVGCREDCNGVLPTASLLDTMRMPAHDLGLGTLAAKGGHGTSWEAATGLWGKDERSLDAAVAGRASREALGADRSSIWNLSAPYHAG